MSSLTSFARDAFERAVKTAAQTAIAAIGTTAALTGVDWATVGDITGMAAALSILTSIGSAFATGGSASLVQPSVAAAAAPVESHIHVHLPTADKAYSVTATGDPVSVNAQVITPGLDHAVS